MSAAKTSKLHELAAKGQSVWLDDLNRTLLDTGQLGRMLSHDAVTGVTSNPTIFAHAISTSSGYDDQLRRLALQGAEATEIYQELVTEDIRRACDLFHDTWSESGGRMGFASIEVAPAVAHESEKTVAEAREWFKRIDRDNLFVKVPATDAGVEAIRRLTSEGLSINVTLVFSLSRYRAVVDAYIAGLERFVAQGGDPSRLRSVASFFVSRVDVEVDGRLERLAHGADPQRADRLRSLKGRAGIANARAAYGIFLDEFATERWKALEARGAHVQQPLWASTGVKDPAYSDTMYVEGLMAPNTVITMPEATIRAFQDHGDPGAGPFDRDAIRDAGELIAELNAVGIDYDEVTEEVLEREGIDKFSKSFDELVASVEGKRAAVLAG